MVRSTRVLVVEDDEDIGLVICLQLEGAGHEVEHVRDGAEAVPRLRELDPDVLVLDLMLPNRSGHDILREVQGDVDLQGIPVVVVTALSDHRTELVSLLGGAVQFLRKPFTLEQLDAAVDRAIDNTPPAGGHSRDEVLAMLESLAELDGRSVMSDDTRTGHDL